MKETRTTVKAAKEAGKILMGHFGKHLKLRDKNPGALLDLVTNADLESNRRIISVLKADFPDYGILSEESPEEKSDSGYRWIIDPLDGTHNFVYGLPLFGVSIALEKDGKVVLGVVNFPCDKRLFSAERGRGCLLNGKRVGVSQRKNIREAMVMFGGSSHPDKREMAEVMRKLEENVLGVRRFGAAVIHHAFVAMGKVEAYVEINNKPWDNAAGFLLVEEAGGKVTDFSGKGWDANTIPFVASNGKVHKEILRIVNQ